MRPPELFPVARRTSERDLLRAIADYLRTLPPDDTRAAAVAVTPTSRPTEPDKENT